MLNTAVILAAGGGKRLRTSSKKDIPKQLYPVAGIPLLERNILQLYNQGIKNFIVVLGYRYEYIRRQAEHYIPSDCNCIFVKNPNWHKSHTGISLKCTEEYLSTNESFICCMGDHLFEDLAIARILDCHTSMRKHHVKPWIIGINSNIYGTYYEYIYSDIRLMLKDHYKKQAFRILSITREQPPKIIPGGFDAIDVGISIVDKRIFNYIKLLQSNWITDNQPGFGDCDLWEAFAGYLLFRNELIGVDIFPHYWHNINSITDIEKVEHIPELCPSRG